MSDPMTPTDYPDKVRALLEAATPGEWRRARNNGSESVDRGRVYVDLPDGTLLCVGGSNSYIYNPADQHLFAASKRIAAAYLDAIAERDALRAALAAEVERLTRVLAVEQGDESSAPPGWTHDIDLTDDDAVREYVWTGPSATVCGSPYDGWRVESAHTGRIVRALYDTALEAMEAADRAAGGGA